MKNQYFGDITDYIRYGILNILACGRLTIAVHWTLTDDDNTNDGKFTKYLSDPKKWRDFAPLPKESIVFLDPDNGLEVKSVKNNAPKAHKYVFFDELSEIWTKGHSLIFHQCYAREPREKIFKNKINRLRENIGCKNYAIIQAKRGAAFIILMQNTHKEEIEEKLSEIHRVWQDEAKIWNMLQL